MIWLSRPPYLRRIGAGVLVAAALFLDCAGRATEPVPFATENLPRGTALADAAVEWRDLPVGAVNAPAELSGYATAAIAAGDPITVAVVGSMSPIPDGWWSVPLELPESVSAGQPVRLVGLEPEFSVDGVVAAAGSSGAFGLDRPGLVAIPPAAADDVARAVATGRLVVLLG